MLISEFLTKGEGSRTFSEVLHLSDECCYRRPASTLTARATPGRRPALLVIPGDLEKLQSEVRRVWIEQGQKERDTRKIKLSAQHDDTLSLASTPPLVSRFKVQNHNNVTDSWFHSVLNSQCP